MNTPYRILFFGTSAFAVPSLVALQEDARFSISGVVTQPDRPTGRHATLTPPPVKTAIQDQAGIPLWQPETLQDPDFHAWLQTIGPTCDAFIVVSYGKILPQWLLDLPRKGVVNVHGSLLPRWRGASPIQAALAAGDTMTGVTIMKMDALLDHGPVIAIAEEPIAEDDTAARLHDRLAMRGAELLPDALCAYLDGTREPLGQDHDRATTCRTLTRDDGRIMWEKPAAEIEQLVRAYTPWPGTWTEYHGKRLKVLGAMLESPSFPLSPGAFGVENGRLFVGCGNGSGLVLTDVQLEGKKPVHGSRIASILQIKN